VSEPAPPRDQASRPSLIRCRRCDGAIGILSRDRTHLEIAVGIRVSGRVPGTRLDTLCRCGQRQSFTEVAFGFVVDSGDVLGAC
jgi:hypothetical protein